MGRDPLAPGGTEQAGCIRTEQNEVEQKAWFGTEPKGNHANALQDATIDPSTLSEQVCAKPVAFRQKVSKTCKIPGLRACLLACASVGQVKRALEPKNREKGKTNQE